MAMTRIHSMADAALGFVSLVGGGVLGMYLLGLLVRRCTSRGLYVGIGVGLVVVFWAYFCGPGKSGLPWLPRFPLHALWIGLTANLVVFSVGYLASLIGSKTKPSLSATPSDYE
jgi:SSS family solute:Na+ symporter